MRIKCCGITRVEDARFAEQAGADAIGVVMFSNSSPRCVSEKTAREIFSALGPFTTMVIVTHTESEHDLERIIALHPDAIQISHPFVFDTPPAVRIIRSIRRGEPIPYDCDAIVVDDSHGGGKHFNPSFAREVIQRSNVPVILAGGLTPENVGKAIHDIQPYAVDVASGIEQAPGIKDTQRILAFIAAAREVYHG
jgi:phosphoribosylanthranilate isomerase